MAGHLIGHLAGHFNLVGHLVGHLAGHFNLAGHLVGHLAGHFNLVGHLVGHLACLIQHRQNPNPPAVTWCLCVPSRCFSSGAAVPAYWAGIFLGPFFSHVLWISVPHPTRAACDMLCFVPMLLGAL